MPAFETQTVKPAASSPHSLRYAVSTVLRRPEFKPATISREESVLLMDNICVAISRNRDRPVIVRKLELEREAIIGDMAHTNNKRNSTLMLLKCIDRGGEFTAP
jgi:hypothetical protein